MGDENIKTPSYKVRGVVAVTEKPKAPKKSTAKKKAAKKVK